ncbi:MAG: exodeoxyribonuclease VII large subunit, partial [Candidatus Thermoplasmatota archaeon]|nr:exodeoxyribonuclease VII large subunit [Candidatus Thermoplasmatota archaeon]
TVQGEKAVEEIVRGLLVAGRLANPDTASRLLQPPIDLIIVGRGGGAPEDLWAFNLEPVVRAIIASKVPVVSAVGHESDLLVADLVADLRASTPSNAIELCVPEYDYHFMLNAHLNERLNEASNRLFIDCRNSLKLLQSRLRNAPLKGIFNANQRVSALSNRLSNAVSNKFVTARLKLDSINNSMFLATQKLITDEATKLAVIEAALNSAHPRNVLARGYSMITDDAGTVISKTSELIVGQDVILALADGSAKATVDEIDKR